MPRETHVAHGVIGAQRYVRDGDNIATSLYPSLVLQRDSTRIDLCPVYPQTLTEERFMRRQSDQTDTP